MHPPMMPHISASVRPDERAPVSGPCVVPVDASVVEVVLGGEATEEKNAVNIIFLKLWNDFPCKCTTSTE